MNCKNCGVEFEMKFCPQCGQKHIERLSFSYFLHIFLGSLFHFHGGKGLFKTMYLLLKNPPEVILEYLEGKRAKYYNPASLYVIFSGLYFFTRIPDNSKIAEQVEQNVHNHYYTLILIIISLPIMASLSFLFFRKYKFNFGEHLILALFYYSANYLGQAIFNIFFKIIGEEFVLGYYYTAFIICLLFYFYMYIFNKKKILVFIKLLFMTPIAILLPYLVTIFFVQYILS